MTVDVRLFAALREIAGASRVRAGGRTAGEVADELSAAHGERFAAIAAVSSFVVNGERADRGTPVAEGDEVAILPPVSGGARSRTLWLLRHAKSSWDHPELDDRDRPLAPRGMRAAALMREYIESEGIRPDLVLCSSALRTRETLAAVLPALGEDLVVRIDPSLYTFDAGALIAVLRDLDDDDIGSVLFVGHNPAMEELALTLASRGDRLAEVKEKFPTGALVEIRFSGAPWSEIAADSGELVRFVTPRQLEG
jgi:phosphohistidine phosphatase